MAKKRTSRKKKGVKKTAPPKRQASAGGLGSVSTAELRRELSRREKQMHKLVARRNKLASEVDALDREIADIAQTIGVSVGRAASSGRGRPAGTTASGAPRKRPHNDMTLEEALAQVLDGKTMGVSEVADAVQDAGYQTSAENFRTIVNQTLIRSKKFKKVSRGQYTAA